MIYCNFHNVRFYNLEPKAISCMAYDPDNKKLALSRHDASIEIWGLAYSPHLERVIQGQSDNSVEALGWVDGRLLSTGLGGSLVEWNVYTLEVRASVTVTGNAAWCLDINKQKSNIAVGTEQGYLNVFSLANNTIVYERIMDKQEGRILCCKYDASGEFVVTGSIDAIRIWNVKTGHAVHKMSTGRSEANKETIVWCLEVTSNFTIISGDSRGKLTFWDGNIGSQIESLTTHKADILTLCLSEDQKTVYSAGVDPQIIPFTYISVKKSETGDVYRWFKDVDRKIHSHDVRALAVCGDKLFSGGIDGYLAVSSYPPKYLHKYPPLLQNPCASVCPQARLLLLRYTNYLEVWRLGKPKEENSSQTKCGNLDLQEAPSKLLEMKSRLNEGIVCSDMSFNGSWLAYSTESSFRLYSFSFQTNASPSVTKISPLPSGCTPARQICFYPNNNGLILASREKSIKILNLVEELPQISQIIDVTDIFGDIIHLLKISPCGQYLTAAALCGRIVVWKLKNDKWDIHCKLPKYKCPATAIGLQHITENNKVNLIAVYADHKLVEYDLKQRRYTSFSVGLEDQMPQQWFNRAMPISHITFHSENENAILMHDDTTVWAVDKSKKIDGLSTKIRKVDYESTAKYSPLRIVKKYKHLVYLAFMGGEEMVAVEVNSSSLIDKLPPPLKKKEFGV